MLSCVVLCFVLFYMNDKFVGSTPTVGAAFYKAVVELNPQQDCDLEVYF